MLTGVFLIAPYATDQTMSVGGRLISMAYPPGDVLLVAVAARVLFVRGRGNLVDTLLALSLLTMLLSDVLLYGSTVLALDSAQTQVADFGYLAAYALLGAAALHRAPTPPAADRRGPVLRSSRLALAPASMAAGALRADRVSLLVGAGASAALFLLVLFRMEGLVRPVQRQADALRPLATTDGLTGLAHRWRWEAELPRALAGAARRGAGPRPLQALQRGSATWPVTSCCAG